MFVYLPLYPSIHPFIYLIECIYSIYMYTYTDTHCLALIYHNLCMSACAAAIRVRRFATNMDAHLQCEEGHWSRLPESQGYPQAIHLNGISHYKQSILTIALLEENPHMLVEEFTPSCHSRSWMMWGHPSNRVYQQRGWGTNDEILFPCAYSFQQKPYGKCIENPRGVCGNSISPKTGKTG